MGPNRLNVASGPFSSVKDGVPLQNAAFVVYNGRNVAVKYDAAKLGKLLGAANYDLAALYQKLTENGGGAGRREEGSR